MKQNVGIRDINVADKQNAYSMSIAIRGIAKLFKLIKCKEDFYCKIIVFSILYNDKYMGIYGHYAVIKNGAVKIYRHSIKDFDFTSKKGKEKWTAYWFTTNIYVKFMLKLHKLICFAINKLPNTTL